MHPGHGHDDIDAFFAILEQWALGQDVPGLVEYIQAVKNAYRCMFGIAMCVRAVSYHAYIPIMAGTQGSNQK